MMRRFKGQCLYQCTQKWLSPLSEEMRSQEEDTAFLIISIFPIIFLQSPVYKSHVFLKFLAAFGHQAMFLFPPMS